MINNDQGSTQALILRDVKALSEIIKSLRHNKPDQYVDAYDAMLPLIDNMARLSSRSFFTIGDGFQEQLFFAMFGFDNPGANESIEKYKGFPLFMMMAADLMLSRAKDVDFKRMLLVNFIRYSPGIDDNGHRSAAWMRINAADALMARHTELMGYNGSRLARDLDTYQSPVISTWLQMLDEYHDPDLAYFAFDTDKDKAIDFDIDTVFHHVLLPQRTLGSEFSERAQRLNYLLKFSGQKLQHKVALMNSMSIYLLNQYIRSSGNSQVQNNHFRVEKGKKLSVNDTAEKGNRAAIVSTIIDVVEQILPEILSHPKWDAFKLAEIRLPLVKFANNNPECADLFVNVTCPLSAFIEATSIIQNAYKLPNDVITERVAKIVAENVPIYESTHVNGVSVAYIEELRTAFNRDIQTVTKFNIPSSSQPGFELKGENSGFGDTAASIAEHGYAMRIAKFNVDADTDDNDSPMAGFSI